MHLCLLASLHLNQFRCRIGPTYFKDLAAWLPSRLAAKKVAFTLAEVLITLGIIGVIAAITLPTVIEKYQKQVVINKLKKNYTTIAQTLIIAQKDNGGMESWDFSDFGNLSGGDAFAVVLPQVAKTYFVPYLDVLYDCGIECKKVSDDYRFLNGQPFEELNTRLYYTVYLKDGSIIFISVDNNGVKMLNLILRVDINGNKGPNTFGKDVFSYYLNTDGTNNIFKTKFSGPVGITIDREALINDPLDGCKKGLRGINCGALIQYDGWQISDDYPW